MSGICGTLPKGHHSQDFDRCEVCEHVFIKKEHDDPDSFFCVFNLKKARPLCLSGYMGETIPHDMADSVWNECYQAWCDFEKTRQVMPIDICHNDFKRKESN